MNALLGQVLSSVLGDYVAPEGLRALRVVGLGERVELRDLTLKREALDGLNAPLRIRYGAVRRCSIHLPGGAGALLASLWSGAYTGCVRVEIDGVLLLVTAQDQSATEVARKAASVKRAGLD